MDRLLGELRQALRALWRNPSFTAIAVITLAVGIGANTAIFSAVNALLLRPLPYPQPQLLVQVWETDSRQGEYESTVSPLNLADWRRLSDSFDALAAYGYLALTLTEGDLPERAIAATVSSSFFSVLDVRPFRGRDFAPEEETPGRNRVVILSKRYWERRFGADSTIVGQTITLDDEPHVIIGVMPAHVRIPSVDLWRPLGLDYRELRRGQHFLFAIGRLRPGVTLAAAQNEMDDVVRRLHESVGEDPNHGVRLVPLHRQLVSDVRARVLVLLGAVGLVLLIACANVANLLLVRASARRREIAIRAALGASRLQLARTLLTESVALAVLAGGLGTLLALWVVQTLTSIGPLRVSQLQGFEVDGPVLAFTLALSIITGLLFGSAPAFQFSRLRLAESLKEGGRTGTDAGGGRLRRGLVVTEVALAIVLLVGAGLLARSFLRLTNVDPGFRAENLLTARLELPPASYPDAARLLDFSDRLLQRLASQPAVESVALVDDLPFAGSRTSSSFDLEASDDGGPDQVRETDARRISPAYFRTMGMPLTAGRALDERDRLESTPALVVNETFARRYFPGREAIGRRLRLGGPEEVALYGEPVWREIVGVVGDITHDDLSAAKRPEVYIPWAQLPSARIFAVIRTRGDAAAGADAGALVHTAVSETDPARAVYDVQTMERRLAGSIALPRFNAQLLGALAAIALLLAAVGVYGVVSYTLAQRTREIGIRMALGAEPGAVLRWLVGGAMRDITIGLLIGLAAALAAAHALRGLLFGVGVADPITLIGVIVVLSAAAFIASWVPARRATRVDPLLALRSE